jgi:hypothetical protein
MIAKIIFGMSTKNSIFYNEEKVKQGKAIELMPFRTIVPTNQINDKIELMDIYFNKNENVKNNSTHIVLSFTAEDKQKKVDFRTIAQDYLEELGYGQQPTFIYYHNDTANPHIHLVTTPIKADGQKISDQYIYLKSNNIRKKLELKYNLKVAETSQIGKNENIGSEFTKQKMQSIIKNALTYKYASFEDFANYLAINSVQVVTKEFKDKSNKNSIGLLYQLNDKKVIKASNFYFKPTFENVLKQIDSTLLKEFELNLLTAFANNSINNYLAINKIEDIKTTNGYFLKDTKNKYIIDSSKLEMDQSVFENYISTEINKLSNKKNINVLISRFYQNYKKEYDFYFESDLIQNLPSNEIKAHLIFHHNIDKLLAKKGIEDFHKFKLRLLPEIKAREIAYFKAQTNKIMDFIDKLNLNANDKFKLLEQFDIRIIKATNLVFHSKSFEINFEKELAFKENNVPNKIPDNINQATIKLLKKMALSESPNQIFIDTILIDPNILILFNKHHLILKENGKFHINSNYHSLLKMDFIEYENEQFLDQNHKNYTKSLRGF